MVKRILFILLLLNFSQFGLSNDKKESKVGGYLRVGTGASGIGGDQNCFRNPGSEGNEFRLGNECGIYGDIEATAVHYSEGNMYFLSKYRFDFFPAGHTSYDDPPRDGSGVAVVNLTEVYVEGGGFIDQNSAAVWVGKRFMRDGDVHMNDFYHYGAINGNGAGIKNFSFGTFKVDFSQFREVVESGGVDDNGSPTSNTGWAAITDKGSNTLTFWDLRIKDIMITESQSLKLWLGFGSTSGGETKIVANEDDGVDPAEDEANVLEFESLTGTTFGLSYRYSSSMFSNEFAILHGSGVMESLSLSQAGLSAVKDNNTIDKSSRLRIVNSSTFKASSNFEGMFALVYEERDNGADEDSKTTWTSLGVRPVYYFSDVYSAALELGQSKVDVESEENGERILSRSTLALQMHPKMGQFTRPVLRAFVTNSSWNDANKEKVNDLDAYDDKNSETSTGFQAEVWF